MQHKTLASAVEAKIEVDFIRATGRDQGTGFIPDERLLNGG